MRIYKLTDKIIQMAWKEAVNRELKGEHHASWDEPLDKSSLLWVREYLDDEGEFKHALPEERYEILIGVLSLKIEDSLHF